MKTIKRIVGVYLALMLGMAQLYAQNILSVSDVILEPNQTIALPISLENTTAIVALQFNLTIPQNATLNTNSVAFTDRATDHQATVRNMGGNNYLFLITSPTNDAILGNRGELLTINLTIDNSFNIGEQYPLTLSNVVLSNRQGDNVMTATQSGTMRVELAPDLYITNVTADKTTYQPQEQIQVSWNVQNIGSLPLQSGWTEYVRLIAANGNERVIATLHKDLGTDSFAAGTTEARMVVAQLPQVLLMEGYVTLQVEIVPNSDSGETIEHTNNNKANCSNRIYLEKQLFIDFPNTISEAEESEQRGYISRSGATDEDEIVVITNTDPRIQMPDTVIIPAGQSGIYFSFTVVPDGIYDEYELVVIAFESITYPRVETQVTVEDDQLPALSLSFSPTSITEGETATLFISLERMTLAEQTLNITCDVPNRFTFNKTLTLPLAAENASLPVIGIDNDIVDGSVEATFTVSLAGYRTAKTNLILLDNDVVVPPDPTLPDATVCNINTDITEGIAGEDNVQVTLTICNTGIDDLPAHTLVYIHLGSQTTTLYTQNAIPTGSSEQLQAQITLPARAGEYTLSATVNPDKAIREYDYTNNYSASINITAIPAFAATVWTNKQQYMPDEVIYIEGQLTGAHTANQPVEVYAINYGYRYTRQTVSDADGKFAVAYQPLKGLCGHFAIGACAVGAEAEDEMVGVDIYGISSTNNVTCDVTAGVPYNGSIKLHNLSALPLNNITARTNDPRFTFSTINLTGYATANLNFTIQADDPTAGRNYEKIEVIITTDEGIETTETIYLYVRSPRGRLAVDAENKTINTTVKMGSYRDYAVTLYNRGQGETGTITFSMPDFITTVTPRQIGSLQADEQTKVIFRFYTNESMTINVPVRGQIGVNCTNGDGLAIPFTLTPVGEGEGILTVDVADEYTYNTAEAPHVAGASVVVKQPITNTIIYEGITDENGLISVTLPNGMYEVTCSATNHASKTKSVMVDPGRENYVLFVLSIETVHVGWTVTETEVEDEYNVTVETTYETAVPAPIVTINVEGEIQPDRMEAGQSRTLLATITNIGVLRADSALLLPIEDDEFLFEPLAYTKPFNLEAKESVVIPIRMTKRYDAVTDGNCSVYFRIEWCYALGSDICWKTNYTHRQKRSCTTIPTPPTGGGNGHSYNGGGTTYYRQITDDCDNSTEVVCATVGLQFSQRLVMTRQAFRGTLIVGNGNETTPMRDVKLTLEVTNQETGAIATAHEFQINLETLNGFTGNMNLEDGWELAASTEGQATILFIPTKYAAPTDSVKYGFGGTLSYIDPFTGYLVTRKLAQQILTVAPSPNLQLTYFMQRDILGDDPLTPQITEPSEEAEFALLINNIGYGTARNMQITTEQPQIVDNEKGLLIDFNLTRSMHHGESAAFALDGSVTNNIGNIEPKHTDYIQWYLTSSLLGHFIDYQVSATHLTSYGNPDLTLLDTVTIHEMIRSVSLPTTEGIGWLVNDIEDPNDTPDAIYYSDGRVFNVGSATATMQKVDADHYRLTIQPAQQGWFYGNIIDSSFGTQDLKQVVRASDGKQVGVRNFWQTYVTLRDGKRPLYENRIHFADSVANTTETYDLYFTLKPITLLDVEKLTGVPELIATTPVEGIDVFFNKPIAEGSFTQEDLSLTVDGMRMKNEQIRITQISDTQYHLDLSNVTLLNGYYTLTVLLAQITDTEGYLGTENSTTNVAQWTQFERGNVAINVTLTPQEGGSVTPDITEVTYGETVEITATPNPGYQFDGWFIDGELVSTNATYTTVALQDINLTAQFTIHAYTVQILSADESMGRVEGSPSGQYVYGTVITVTAIANEDYVFSRWSDGNRDATREITVEGNVTLTAIFAPAFVNVSVAPAEHGYITGAGKYPYGAEVTLTAVPDNDYQLDAWDDGSTNPVRTIIAESDTTISAVFGVKKYQITVESTDTLRGTTTGTGAYPFRTILTIAAIPNEGYSFYLWDDGDKNATRQIVVLKQDETYRALFTPNWYNINVRSANGEMGSVQGSGSYAYQTEVTLTAIPNEGYHFLNWSDGNTDSIRTIVVGAANAAYTAYFAPNRYTITAQAADTTQGYAIGSGEYNYKAVVTLQAIAYSGYQFVQWNDGNRNARREIVVSNANAVYEAIFTPNWYYITVLSNDEQMGTVEGSGEYACGTEIIIRAIPNEDYQLLYWSDGNTETERTITVGDTDETFIAYFEKITYTGINEQNITATTWQARCEYLTLQLIGTNNQPYQVFATDGRLVYSGTQNQIKLPAEGIYLIRCNGETQKVTTANP